VQVAHRVAGVIRISAHGGRTIEPRRRTSPQWPVRRTGDGAPVAAGRSANLSAMAPSRSLGRRLLAVLLAVPALLLLAAAPAFAAAQDPGTGDIGDVHNPAPQSLPVMLGLYVGIPALGFLIAILLSMRSGKKSDRYRPGRPWEHDPAWFGTSVEESQQDQEQRRRAALPGAGGASGQW
jgi:hypothetical protein